MKMGESLEIPVGHLCTVQIDQAGHESGRSDCVDRLPDARARVAIGRDHHDDAQTRELLSDVKHA